MATNTLKTRIALLYKSYQEWDEIKDSYIPLKGEVCFCEVPASSGTVVQEPALLFKVGDGIKTFEALPWGSALAADVYGWAKKESLEFTDLSENFLANLDERIEDKSESFNYQIVQSDIDGIWKFQKKKSEETVWTDVSTVDVKALLNKKVDKELVTSDGSKALIFNEIDGGGAKFENKDGTASFVGVNSDTNGGIGAQLYDIDVETNKGAKLDVTKNGIFYTVGDESAKPASQRDIEANALATKKDIQAISAPEYSLVKEADAGDYAAIYHLTKNGTNVGVAINIPKDQLLKAVEVKICSQKDSPIEGLVVGDKYLDFTFIVEKGAEAHTYIAIKDMVKPYSAGEGIIISSNNEITYDPEVLATVEYVDANISDTMAYIIQEDRAEHAGRVAGDELLEAKKVDKLISSVNGEAYIFNEADGGGAKFVHIDGSEAYVGVNNGGKDGLMAQIYADIEKDGKWSGSRINVYNDKIYYQNKEATDAGKDKNAEDLEIATKGDIENFSNNLNPIAFTGDAKNLTQTVGDVLILDCN